MNKDYYSDIKISERFIFENSLFLMNIFDKKVESFVRMIPREEREAQRLHLLNPNNILPIEVQNFFQDHFTQQLLNKDLTKPLWGCQTKANPHVILEAVEYHDKLSLRKVINNLMGQFFEKFKNQNQDQSSLCISIDYARQSIYEMSLECFDNELELIKLIYRYNKYEMKMVDYQLQKGGNIMYEQYRRDYHVSIDTLFRQILQGSRPKLTKSLFSFINTTSSDLIKLLDQSKGPIIISYQPSLENLSLYIHPMLYTINNLLHFQNNSRASVNRVRIEPLLTMKSIVEMEEERQDVIFEKIKMVKPVKVTFINFDGHDAEHNLILAKYLSDYLQYISFPEQFCGSQGEQDIKFAEFQSNQYMRHMHNASLDQRQRQHLRKCYDLKQVQQKKRIVILPVRSLELEGRYNLPNVSFYASNFIRFMMKEIVCGQIKDFGPSLIVISISERTKIQNQHFEEIMRELTVLSNFRIVLYTNYSQSYTHSEKQSKTSHQQFKQNLFKSQRYPLLEAKLTQMSLFQKFSIFLTTTSGLLNLSPTHIEQKPLQKYKNYQIMRYVGGIFTIISKESVALVKFRDRGKEYITLEKVLRKGYCCEEFKNKVEGECFGFFVKLKNDTFQVLQKKQQIQQYEEIMQIIRSKYNHSQLIEIWYNHFEYDFLIEQSKKYYTSIYYANLPLYSEQLIKTNSITNIIALCFKFQSKILKIYEQTKIHYDSIRKKEKALIYLINCFVEDADGGNFRNFCGVVNQENEKCLECIVEMNQVEIRGEEFLGKSQYYVDFNYCETDQFVLMFWPQKFDWADYLLHKLASKNYNPVITNHIFIANRQNPSKFTQLKIQSSPYNFILPRSRCTCYEVPQTSKIYVFGGFYTNNQNYLRFQSDITLIDYGKGIDKIEVQNVPKRFYFQYENVEEKNVILELWNDFVRPRVQFEIIEGISQDLEERIIFLVGGVGEKFLRPYSLIGYMAHRIKFQKPSGMIKQIKRIQMHNLVPINLKEPIKEIQSMSTNTITNSSGRFIETNPGQTNFNSVVSSKVNIRFNKEEERFEYSQGYTFCIEREGQASSSSETLNTMVN